jgi:hypothetical protein
LWNTWCKIPWKLWLWINPILSYGFHAVFHESPSMDSEDFYTQKKLPWLSSGSGYILCMPLNCLLMPGRRLSTRWNSAINFRKPLWFWNWRSCRPIAGLALMMKARGEHRRFFYRTANRIFLLPRLNLKVLVWGYKETITIKKMILPECLIIWNTVMFSSKILYRTNKNYLQITIRMKT